MRGPFRETLRRGVVHACVFRSMDMGPGMQARIHASAIIAGVAIRGGDAPYFIPVIVVGDKCTEVQS